MRTYSRRTGTQLGGGLTEANSSDFFIRLKPLPRRSIDEIMDEIRGKIEQTVPGVKIELALLMEDLIGDLTAVPQPIEIKLYSDSLSQLRSLAPRVAEIISRIRGVVDVKNGIVLAGDALEIKVDRTKAALEGVDPERITRMLNNTLTGVVTTKIQKEVKMIGVRVWIPQNLRASTTTIGQLLLRAPDGHLFPLRRIARLVPVSGQPEISSENLKPMVAVTGRISGRDLGSVMGEVGRALRTPGLIPPGGLL